MWSLSLSTVDLRSSASFICRPNSFSLLSSSHLIERRLVERLDQISFHLSSSLSSSTIFVGFHFQSLCRCYLTLLCFLAFSLACTLFSSRTSFLCLYPIACLTHTYAWWIHTSKNELISSSLRTTHLKSFYISYHVSFLGAANVFVDLIFAFKKIVLLTSGFADVSAATASSPVLFFLNPAFCA